MLDNHSVFFTQNMALLKNNHRRVWEFLTRNPSEPVGEICLAPNGMPNLWVNDSKGNRLSLHIPHGPEIEAGQFLDMVSENFTGVVTITGMGLGYAALALIQQRPNLRHLAIFEPQGGIFLQALHAHDLAPLLSDPRLILGIGPDVDVTGVLGPAHKALQLESIQNLQHLPSFSLDHEQYQKLHETIYRHCSSFNIEGNTMGAMGRDFLQNRLHHLTSMHHDRLLMELAEKFTGLPAILVAAGPSLDKNVHLLGEAKGKALIIAADSALPALVTKGVMPDLLGTIDPLELIFEKVAGVTPKVHDVSLICMSWASSKMAKLFPCDQIFWGFGGKPIEAWLSQLYGNEVLTAGAGSVAHLNLLCAIIMRCSPIIFVGQDLSFSPSHSHSANAVLQTNDLVDSLLANQEDVVWLDGINGGKVISNRGMHSHKLFLEQVIEKQQGHYINATEGGCRIEGTEAMSLRDALDRYCAKKIGVTEIIAPPETLSLSARRTHLLKEFRKTTQKGTTISRQMDKADHLSNTLRQWLHKEEKRGKTYQAFASLPAPIQKKIAELDNINKELDAEHTIWPLLQEATIDGLRHSEQQRHALAMVAKDPQRYMEWLQKNALRFLEINKIRREVLSLLTNHLAAATDFLRAEEKLLGSAQKNGANRAEILLELARLYYEAGNLNLARPWIKDLSELLPESAEANFLQGWIAAHYTEYTEAEAFFAKAVATDPDYAARIASFRQRQGDAYVKYAAHFQHTDKAVARRLLLKGLIYAPEHVALERQLITLCDQALQEIKKQRQGENREKIKGVAEGWLTDLAANNRLAALIGPDRAAQLHHGHGMILAEQKEYSQAIEAFTKALDLRPNDPALHIALTDMCFALDDYAQGIAHLGKAISLDNSLAVYWEEIGDSLAEALQHEDALAAYEKCFTILPERLHLLKKIGDCYSATGQLEAAKEAYLHLKGKMQSIEASAESVQ